VTEPAALPAGIARVSVPSPFAIGAVNAYLLEGDPLTLVDPGPSTAKSRAALEEGLRAAGHEVEDVEQILLTHQHHDHVGLASWVRERSGASVAAIEPLARFLSDFERAMDADDAYAVTMMRRHGVDDETAETLNELSRSWRHVGGGVEVDRILVPGETVRAGGRELAIEVRPGHSPTDTVFLEEGSGVLIGGDHLLERVSSNPIVHAPIGVADPEAAARAADRPRPLRAYLDSFARTEGMDIAVVLPGHGDPFTGHRELIADRRTMHARRADRIWRRIGDGATAAEVAHSLWRRMAVHQAFLALSEVLGHVDLLVEDGRVRETGGGPVVRLERVGAPD
jgi:glyoxylase-like metal-dependent hydrolase (beta-lactamase superfamily II)